MFAVLSAGNIKILFLSALRGSAVNIIIVWESATLLRSRALSPMPWQYPIDDSRRSSTPRQPCRPRERTLPRILPSPFRQSPFDTVLWHAAPHRFLSRPSGPQGIRANKISGRCLERYPRVFFSVCLSCRLQWGSPEIQTGGGGWTVSTHSPTAVPSLSRFLISFWYLNRSFCGRNGHRVRALFCILEI